MPSVPPPMPPPTLDYASRRPRRVTADDWRAFAAACGLISAAVVVTCIVGLATTYVLHELFVLCFGT